MIRVVFRAGKPYLFGTAWKTLLEPNDWLYSLRGDGATQSPQTWRAYAYALGDHLAWCHREGVDWRTLGGPEMERYLSSLAVGDSTLNWKIAVLVRFYCWCEARGIRLRAPFTFRETLVRRPSFFGRDTARSVMRPSVMRRVAWSEQIIVPRVSDVWTLRNALSCWRDRLIVESFAFTGMRCAELLGLRTEPFLAARIDAKESAVFVKVVGKGRKPRLVPFPATLVRDLQRYILLDRKYVPGAEHTDRVFLSTKGAPLSASGLQFRLRTASRRLGLQMHPHLLRHFFACHRLRYLSGLGLGDPLGQLQRELGHSQITTTLRYLHLTDELRVRIASDHQEFVAALAMGGKVVSSDAARIEAEAMQRERHAP
jgi:site-specific recombinase XerD